VTLGGNRTVTVSANNLTVGGSIGGGAVDLTKLGAGTLTLTTGSTFTGTLGVNAGTIALAPAAAGAFTMGNALAGAGTLEASPFAADGSDLTLVGDLGGFTGTLNVATSGGFNSKLATTGTTSSFGAGAVVNIANGGTWFSSANQTGVTVNMIGTGNSEGLGALRLDNATLDSTSSLVLKADGSIGGNGSSTINAPISEDGGSFGFTKQGTGTLFLGGANSYSGLTAVSAGVLVLQNASALGTTAGATSVADGFRVELDNLTVSGEAITIAGAGGDNLGALRSRSGTSVWDGPVTVAADLTRIGAITGSSFEVSGVIDDGANDYRIRFRPNSATATIIVSGANTYTGGTSIFGGIVVAGSLNSVVGGSASSSFGAPVTEANGMIILGIAGTVNDGTLRYIGTGETTDRTFQLGDNSATPAAGDIGAGAIENNGTAGPLVFSAPVFNTPTNNTINTSAPTRILTLGGSNTGANTISGVIQNNQVAGAPTAPVAVTKNGIGTWVLAGANTYTGNTTVNDGTLELADDAQLRFVLGATSGVNNNISGAGTLILNGDFVINTTAADALASGTWTLENVASATYGPSFSVLGFTDAGGDKWTKDLGATRYTFDESTGVLTLAQAGYAAWIAGFFPGETNPLIIGPAADPDNDGIPNGVEMVIGGDPKLGMDTALLPTVELVTDPVGVPAIPAGNYMLFTYRRSDLSVAAGVTADCETDTDLVAPWTPATGAPGVVIQVDDNFTFTPPAAADTDRVRVYVPRGANEELFGRLSVLVP
jgi:fibronectin-binding autotransporter adhesin